MHGDYLKMASRPALHSVEAEQQVLGAMMLFPDVRAYCPFLLGRHFYDPVHQRIADAIIGVLDDGHEASPERISYSLGDDTGLKEIGGKRYLYRLAETAVSVSPATIRGLAEILHEYYCRREADEALSEVLVDLRDTSNVSGTSQILGRAEASISAIASEMTRRDLVAPFETAVDEALSRLDDIRENGARVEISTGFARLDAYTGGLQRGRHYCIAGRTSMGKTALGLAIAQNVAGQEDRDGRPLGVLFVSLEMPAVELANRMISAALAKAGHRIPYDAITRGAIDDGAHRLVCDEASRQGRLSLYTVDDECSEIGKIRAAASRAKKLFEADGAWLALVVVDYIQIVDVEGARTRSEKTAFAAIEMKRMAKAHDCSVISLSQISRGVEDQTNNRPTLSDLRWSGELEEASDVVAMVYRDAYYLERDADREDDPEERARINAQAHAARHEAEVLIEKNRGGQRGRLSLYADMPTNHFADEAPVSQDEEAF